MAIAVVLALGLVTGKVHLVPKHVSAEQVLLCDTQDGQCPEDTPTCLDANEQSIPIPAGQHADDNGLCVANPCPNMPDQTTIPTGYHYNQKTDTCVQDSVPHVLGASILSDNK